MCKDTALVWGPWDSIMVEALCYKSKVTGSKPNELNAFFLNLPNSFGRTRPLSLIQHLTEMSTRSRKIMFLGSKARRVRGADNIAAICEPTV
jgi:hypothetical protein